MTISVETLARELYKNDFRNNQTPWSESGVAIQDLFRIQASRAISLNQRLVTKPAQQISTDPKG